MTLTLVFLLTVLVTSTSGGASAQGHRPVARAAAAPTRVSVTLVDFRFRFSRLVLPPGKVVFDVVNRGAVAHDLVFAKGDRTRVLQPGRRQTITVSFSKAGVYRFYCSVPGHRALGMNGTLQVRPKPVPKPKPGKVANGGTVQPATSSSPAAAVALTPIASGLGPLTDVTSPPNDPDRLMVVQQDGLVLLAKNDAIQPRPFLDLRSVVRADGEKGLLSIAFAPDYEASGLLYADYNDLNGNLRIVEYHRTAGDPDSADPDGRELLRIIKPTANHNGGGLQFGPDGDLYVSVGDGGADPPRIPVGVTGQTLDDLFGSILRIDPRRGSPYAIPPTNPFIATPDARPEIVAYGLRNPWRFWIDSQTNTMLIGDVGESTREEIDRLPLDQLGLNFGWPCKEGTATPDVLMPAGCKTAALTAPLYEYPHSPTRCSITGGITLRDPRLPALDGLYLFSDLCDGHIYTINSTATPVMEHPLGVAAAQPTSFGADALNRAYVTTATGIVFRLDPAQ